MNRTEVLAAMDDAFTAEIQDMMDRFLPASETVVNDIPPDANKAPGIFLERHYFPEHIPPGTGITANVRVKNIGQHPWSSRTDEPLLLTVMWTSQEKKQVCLQAAPVRFPVDIAPKRSITVPVPVSTPLNKGVYKLTVCLVNDKDQVAVMCEPVNDTLEGKETIRELQKGINEQVFTWSEYVQIFDMAGLHISSLQIDGGSLKAILTGA